MDSLQEAFNHPPESYEACFIIDAFGLLNKNTRLALLMHMLGREY